MRPFSVYYGNCICVSAFRICGEMLFQQIEKEVHKVLQADGKRYNRLAGIMPAAIAISWKTGWVLG